MPKDEWVCDLSSLREVRVLNKLRIHIPVLRNEQILPVHSAQERKFPKKPVTFFPYLRPSPLGSGDYSASQDEEKQALSSVPAPFNPGSLSLPNLEDVPIPF